MESVKQKHSQLMKVYLPVYLLAVISDWLQGPYVYALYDAYGYTQHEIAVLFVAGFGSSMIFGSFIGGLADSCGRKKFTILYAATYALSCATKHFKSFSILMLGRLLGGVATSLLFSVFDSWLIRAHSDAGVSAYLSKSFSTAMYGNSIVAIIAGLIANKATGYTKMAPVNSEVSEADAVFYKGGYLNPFDIAFLALVVCALLAGSLWTENYGDSSSDDDNDDKIKEEGTKVDDVRKPWYSSFKDAWEATIKSNEIMFCGLISSLFEGSMFIFVFMWTPSMQTLTKTANPDFDGDLPFGLIFSTFMVSCMAGSSTFAVLIEQIEVKRLGINIFYVATAAFAIMAISSSDTITFLAFLLFEMCVGMYFPMMGTMKSRIVPENNRAAIYNLYRIPLNFIVLFSLLTDLTPTQSFSLCFGMLVLATILQRKLVEEKVEKSAGNEKQDALAKAEV